MTIETKPAVDPVRTKVEAMGVGEPDFPMIRTTKDKADPSRVEAEAAIIDIKVKFSKAVEAKFEANPTRVMDVIEELHLSKFKYVEAKFEVIPITIEIVAKPSRNRLETGSKEIDDDGRNVTRMDLAIKIFKKMTS